MKLTFKNFLAEKAMNSREFKKTIARQGKSALVGYEFEIFVPEDTELFHGADNDLGTMAVRDLSTLEMFLDYFSLTGYQIKDLEREYDDWVSKQKKDNPSASVKATSFEEFLNTQFSSIYKMIELHEFQPSYGWEVDYGNDSSIFYTEEGTEHQSSEETFEAIRDSLKDWMDAGWSVVADRSIHGDDDDFGAGVEVISPPTALKDALHDCKIMFDWIKSHRIVTNETTGLHINISLANMKNVDPVKLILFLGEKHVLKAFGRETNNFTNPQIELILAGVAKDGELPKDANAMAQKAKALLSNEKYSSVNLNKLKQGYLEFRIAGGEDYHLDYEKVRNTTLRFVTALEVACDPTAERELYIKKLSQIFGKSAESASTLEYDDRTLPELLDMDGKEDTVLKYKTWQKNVRDGKVTSPSSKKRLNDWTRDHLLPDIFTIMKALHMNGLSGRQRAELKLFVTRADINVDSVLIDAPNNVRNKFGFLYKTK